MPIIDSYHERIIDNSLIIENARNTHIRSGKLSASKLGWPLQWQVLSALGVPTGENDPYTLRKFKRGKDVETQILSFFKCLSTQNEVVYRDVVGVMDAFMNSQDWDTNYGLIPVEVKSVTNAKFKRLIGKFGEPQKSHILQACLYALAMNTDYFALLYVAADDYRTRTYVFKTEDYKQQIDTMIDAYDHCVKNKIVPLFVPLDKWHEKKIYNPFPEWAELTQEEIAEKLQTLKIEFK